MAGDLGSAGGQVHAEAAAVLRFWFEETPEDKRFARDDALDREIARRFGRLRERLAGSGAAGWEVTPETVLAAMIVLDQFSRNLHRGEAAAFAADARARTLADAAIRRGWDVRLAAERRQFLYMPFMHAESVADQDRSVALFEALGEAEPLKFARLHRDVIARFGRFPGRNAALGRASTAAEEAYLAEEEQLF